MVYKMVIYTDGGCRNNGRHGASGAAAAVFIKEYGGIISCTRPLPLSPVPTSQRAKITGIIIALEQALERYEMLNTEPYLDVTIHTDSKYAVSCITTWIYKWVQNGWINARGTEVSNRDLIEKASELDDQVKELGDVEYVWIPREENEAADELCREILYD
ncbi:uncharacterized protein N7483_012459 [Penicillium malachiteum]|uniref:uncharacterized protein n=1 Tax=Penicillium malachiteum TaxID=1324776 RepID=UPI002546D3B7|nr:uncharacterized protein N7483_012459 [Penicillium malachiteum]KAJ5715278.1 hypothetical protein N7483_012459 [Penicillium malachiteum]